MARPMRVLLLNERCHENPLGGGAETHLFEIFGRLAERGVETTLLCCGFGEAAGEATHRGVAIRRLGKRLSYYGKVPGEVRRCVAAGEVDLVVEALNKVPFLSPLYAKVPVLAIHHHLHGRTAFRQVNPALALGAISLELLLPLVYRQVQMLTISHSSKGELVWRGLPEEHIDVVPCGIDHEIHRPAPLEGREPIVLSVGRLEPYKRLDLLVRAFALAHAARPDARLVILGRGQEEQRLRDLAAQLRLEGAVTFGGYVSEAEKVAWMQRAALFVQCSRKEGWGLTVVEAQACGAPVIATDVPGLRDSVHDGCGGWLVHRAKPKTLARALLRLLDDEPKRVQFARYALGCVQRFDWDDAATDVATAIARLIPQAKAADSTTLTGVPVPQGSPRRDRTMCPPETGSAVSARAEQPEGKPATR